jgi:hypothetical protein
MAGTTDPGNGHYVDPVKGVQRFKERGRLPVADEPAGQSGEGFPDKKGTSPDIDEVPMIIEQLLIKA